MLGTPVDIDNPNPKSCISDGIPFEEDHRPLKADVDISDNTDAEELRFRRGLFYGILGDHEKAMDWMNKIMQDDPTRKDGWGNMTDFKKRFSK